MSGPKITGNTSAHQHAHVTHPKPQQKKAAPTPQANPAPPQTSNSSAHPAESASTLLAINRGLDSRLMRARIEAKLPRAQAAVATTSTTKTSATSAKSSRRPSADPYNPRWPKTSDPDRNPAINLDRNRAVNPDRREIGSDGKLTKRSFTFPVKPDTHVYDGRLKDRGRIVAGSVRLNYGQQKTMGGQKYVYAFATKIEKNGKTRHISGWIPASSLELKTPLQDVLKNNITTVDGKHPPNDHGPYREYTITGGDRSQFGKLKVVPNSHKRRERADDYMNRGGVVNMLHNLPGKGGVSTDTLPVGATFHRSNVVKPRSVKLYQPGSSHPVQKRLTFVYGFVKDPQSGARRYGWIAEAALGKQHKA